MAKSSKTSSDLPNGLHALWRQEAALRAGNHPESAVPELTPVEALDQFTPAVSDEEIEQTAKELDALATEEAELRDEAATDIPTE